jgi:hypothetical protein
VNYRDGTHTHTHTHTHTYLFLKHLPVSEQRVDGEGGGCVRLVDEPVEQSSIGLGKCVCVRVCVCVCERERELGCEEGGAE